MTTEPPASEPVASVRRLSAAARELWGAERAAALDGAIERLSAALTTVETFPVSPGVGPYPTGPEAPRA